MSKSQQQDEKDNQHDVVDRRPQHRIYAPNFNLDTAFQYYAIMRLIGYIHEGTYSNVSRRISDTLREEAAEKKAAELLEKHSEYNGIQLSIDGNISTFAAPTEGTIQLGGIGAADAEKNGTKGMSLPEFDREGVVRDSSKKISASRINEITTSTYSGDPTHTPTSFSYTISSSHGENTFLKAVDDGSHNGKKNGKNFFANNSISDHEVKANNAVNALETATFLGWTIYTFMNERRESMKHFGSVFAAETGDFGGYKSVIKLEKSENPLIASMMDRFNWQTSTRGVSDMMFLVGLKPGILAKALSITLERSVFMNKLAYEKLRDMVDDAQWNNMGERAHTEVTDTLIKIAQQSCRETHIPAISKEQLVALAPAFGELKDRIIDKKYSLPEVTYILGDIVVHPNEPQRALDRIHEVDAKGLRNIGNEKAKTKGLPLAEPLHRDQSPEKQSIVGRILGDGPRKHDQFAIQPSGGQKFL